MVFVYITTNLVNGKQYVGSHKTDNVNDKYLGSGIILKKSVKKYGKEYFKREILEICENFENAHKLECYYIKEYNTLIPNGYNICEFGGAGIPNTIYSEEYRKKISEGIKKFYIENEEERIKISLRFKDKSYVELYGEEKANELKEKRKTIFNENNPIKGKFGIDNPNYGSKRTEETKELIREKLKNKPKSKEHKKSLSKAWEKRKIENPITEETRLKKSVSMKNKNAKNFYKLINPNGEIITINNLSQFAKDNNLIVSLLIKVSKGKRTHHKNWKCEKIK